MQFPASQNKNLEIYLGVTIFSNLPGLDVPKHGEPAYPYSSYGDGWGESPPTINGKHNGIGLTNRGAYDVTVPPQ